jgi:hypothetical protein
MAESKPGAGFGRDDNPVDPGDAMAESHEDAEYRWGEDPLDDEIHKLVEMVTELGIEAENILFDAVTALLGEGTHGALLARAAGVECEKRYQIAHQRGLDLIMSGGASPDQIRWIMDLQQIGLFFRRVAQDATWIAMQSLALQQPVDDILVMVGANMNLLEYLVEQTRLQMRKAIIFTTTREHRYVREIIENTSDIQRAYIVLESRVQGAIRAYPRISFPMQQLLGIATRLQNIGTQCHSIATAMLYNPPRRPPAKPPTQEE